MSHVREVLVACCQVGKLAKILGKFMGCQQEYACASAFIEPVTVELAGEYYFKLVSFTLCPSPFTP